MTDFVHLHLHSEYSLLDGACRISEIADKAIAEGQKAVAITDHGVMYGCVEFYNSLKAKGIKPIIGVEAYVAPRGRLLKEGKGDSSGHHLILLCKNEIGYRNLCYMVSRSFIDGFYMRPRIDMDLIREHHEGLIALSGCIGGKIPQMILAGSMPEAEAAAAEMKALFGEDFYLEIQNHHMDEERKVAYGLRLIGEKLGIELVATNDVHYLEKSDADIQRTLLCIQTGNVLSDGTPFGFETDEYYFRSSAEMEALFSSFPHALENTVRIAEKCNFDFRFGTYFLPTFTPQDGKTHKEQLRSDAEEGFKRRLADGRFDFDRHPREEYATRMEYELSVIDKMGFNAYFLIVADFVRFAKSRSIPVGPGRGSGAGSLVAFCIGITDVDPLHFDLLFERFLNPERVSMPDFDIDFCDEEREQVISYVKSKYGEDKVAQIVTFGTLAARAAVRDVGRALGMPYSAVDAVAKCLPKGLNITLDDALKTKEFKQLYDSSAETRKLIDVSRRLEGMPRHASTHAAGVVITERPTWEYVPLSYSGNGVVTQFDMNTVAKLGLVKFDFLGLRYLSVIRDAETLIRRRDPSFDIQKIPTDDPATFSLLCDGRTDGVFQLESAGMKKVLTGLRPKNLEDIIACIALYRPGPMDSIDDFIERAHGRRKTEYRIPALASILDVTHGCIVYQEQVMQIFRNLAGYSFAQADLVRRAMAKKKEADLLAERGKFLEGCSKSGIATEDAERLFEEMVGFASYAFNKSHATCYGILSYRTAYLKAHAPAEYFAALMTSVLSWSDKVRMYIADARKYGVRVLPPDVNESEESFAVVNGNIRFGLLAIRNVGRPIASAIVRERKRRHYTDFADFVRRMSENDLNKKTLEFLIKSGGFDSFGITRSSLLSCYEQILETEHGKKRNNLQGQLDMFSALSADTVADAGFEYPQTTEFAPTELLLLEKESTGMFFSGHLLDGYSERIDAIRPDRIGDILAAYEDRESQPESGYRDRSKVRLCGILSSVKTRSVKNGDKMATARLEDASGEIELIAFPKTFAVSSDLMYNENAVYAEGTLSVEEGDETRSGSIRVILTAATPLTKNGENPPPKTEAEKTTCGKVFIRIPQMDTQKLQVLERISSLYPGKTEIILYDASSGKYVRYKGLHIDRNENVEKRLCERYGKENIVFRD